MGPLQEKEPMHPISHDSYDLLTLGMQLGTLGYGLRFEPETESTMDIAATVGTKKTVVLTDHQTQGRGRYERSWLDQPGQSVLMTVVEPFDTNDPGPFSGLPSHMFSLAVCLALQEVTGNTDIKLRWPGDPFYKGRKLGGVIVDNYDKASGFGVGINVDYANADLTFPETDSGAVSLYEITGKRISRQNVVIAILKKWNSLRVELKTFQNNERYDIFNTLWKKNAELLDRKIRITGLYNDQIKEGLVIDSPLGKGIILQTLHGTEEIVDYDTHTKIDIVE